MSSLATDCILPQWPPAIRYDMIQVLRLLRRPTHTHTHGLPILPFPERCFPKSSALKPVTWKENTDVQKWPKNLSISLWLKNLSGKKTSLCFPNTFKNTDVQKKVTQTCWKSITLIWKVNSSSNLPSLKPTVLTSENGPILLLYVYFPPVFVDFLLLFVYFLLVFVYFLLLFVYFLLVFVYFLLLFVYFLLLENRDWTTMFLPFSKHQTSKWSKSI